MKKIINVVLFCLLFSTSSGYADRVFPEKTLKKFGYKTSNIDEKAQHIRSFKNYGKSKERFYARFTIWTTTHETPDEAAEEKKRIDAKFGTFERIKDYTQIVKKGNVLYHVRATSNYTRLEHQPDFIRKIKKHFLSQ